MIEHVKRTFETIDGKIFDNEDEAYAYENQLIYKRSGFRFYRDGRHMIKEVERCYDECDYFTVDHSKKKENQDFLDMAFYYYGWGFPGDILENTSAKKYRYDFDENKWKSVSRKSKSVDNMQ